MTKRDIFRKFVSGSAESVVAHANWQRSRGRRPSMGFGDFRNPRLAYETAKEQILDSVDASIDSFAQAAMDFYAHQAEEVELEPIQDAPVPAIVPSITVEDIMSAIRVVKSATTAEEVRRGLDEIGHPEFAQGINLPDDPAIIAELRRRGAITLRAGVMAIGF
ncbi:MAG: hypothetical protein AAB766_01640 [Patescibacteria group bacterium]